MYNVVVEDRIPAGAEVLNLALKTSQQGEPASQPSAQEDGLPQFDPSDPFAHGWGWWLFNTPQVHEDHIRWVAAYLPAGAYELTYRLVPFLPGEFRLIPARAWQYYFPEIEGSSAGGILTIH